MHAAHTHTKFVRAAAIAVGAVLLAIGAPVAHAGPEDGPGSDNTPTPSGPASLPKPLEISVSENPVYFAPTQTTKTINFTWTPQPDSKVWVDVSESGVDMWGEVLDKGLNGPLNLTVTYGQFYWVWVCREIHDTCPLAIITTKRKQIATPTLEQAPLPLPQPEPGRDRPQVGPADVRPNPAPGAAAPNPSRSATGRDETSG